VLKTLAGWLLRDCARNASFWGEIGTLYEQNTKYERAFAEKRMAIGGKFGE
jgi:hypothetical protein